MLHYIVHVLYTNRNYAYMYLTNVYYIYIYNEIPYSIFCMK